jgi:hypothetical protein
LRISPSRYCLSRFMEGRKDIFLARTKAPQHAKRGRLERKGDDSNCPYDPLTFLLSRNGCKLPLLRKAARLTLGAGRATKCGKPDRLGGLTSSAPLGRGSLQSSKQSGAVEADPIQVEADMLLSKGEEFGVTHFSCLRILPRPVHDGVHFSWVHDCVLLPGRILDESQFPFIPHCERESTIRTSVGEFAAHGC